MTTPALIHSTVSEANRHKRPWKDNSRTPLVPLWTADPRGEEIEGRIVVPLRLCFTQEHTNERLEFMKLLSDNLDRWTEWRKRRGWLLNSRPKIRGPYLPATSGSDRSRAFAARAERALGKGRDVQEVPITDHAEEVRWFFVKARFKRETPVYQKLEDVLEIRRLTEIYSQPEVKDTGWVNPLEHAEARRRRLGIRREDYLFGSLATPL